MTDFNLSHAQYYFQSEETFPVPLENAWQWLGYSRKDKLVDVLKNNFEEGFDYSLITGETPQGGRPSDLYYLPTYFNLDNPSASTFGFEASVNETII
jgi:hypothetical protein